MGGGRARAVGRAPETPAGLSIGEVAARASLTPTALRMWETRYGFPRAERLPGKHRRYTAEEADRVAEVVQLRNSGLRLDQAIAHVLTRSAPSAPSMFTTLRERHPHLAVHRLRKSTMIAISRAIEDEVAVTADRAVVWGAFQRQRYFDASSPRWRDLAVASAGATVFADFETSTSTASPRRVALEPGAPMLREWGVVVDSRELPVTLSGWELPGQTRVPDHRRTFEAVWTIEPPAVRDAARVCARTACEADPSFDHAPFRVPPAIETGEEQRVSTERIDSLLGRVATYVDRIGDSDPL